MSYESMPPGLARWCASRKNCPKYLCYCPLCFRLKKCDDRTEEDKQEDLETSSSDFSLFDGHSISHIVCGMITSIPVFYIEWYFCLLITFGVAGVFELVENSGIGVTSANSRLCYTICYSFDQGAQDGEYKGDNIYNSIMDVLCNVLGFFLLFSVKLLTDL
jgi:hypothetical protein